VTDEGWEMGGGDTGVTLRLAPLEEKPKIAALMRDYLAELGPWGYGEPDYPFLDFYWREERRSPFLIEADGALAGFALVNAVSISGYPVDATIAEFYVLPPFRRRGCGACAASLAFRARPGWWELSFHRDNPAARVFWPAAAERAGARRVQFYDVGESRILRFRMMR
jgi:predicted acetyltransferase